MPSGSIKTFNQGEKKALDPVIALSDCPQKEWSQLFRRTGSHKPFTNENQMSWLNCIKITAEVVFKAYTCKTTCTLYNLSKWRQLRINYAIAQYACYARTSSFKQIMSTHCLTHAVLQMAMLLLKTVSDVLVEKMRHAWDKCLYALNSCNLNRFSCIFKNTV